MRGVAIFSAALLALASCDGGSTPAASPSRCPAPQPQKDLSLLPDDIPFADYGIVTNVEVKGGFLIADAIDDDTTIIEAYPPMGRDLQGAGYDILNVDNEGFEAEIFFARGKEVVGTYRLREGPCPGQVQIKMLYAHPRYEKA